MFEVFYGCVSAFDLWGNFTFPYKEEKGTGAAGELYSSYRNSGRRTVPSSVGGQVPVCASLFCNDASHGCGRLVPGAGNDSKAGDEG